MNRYLILEDGTVLKGVAFGYTGDSYGEIVFTTSMAPWNSIFPFSKDNRGMNTSTPSFRAL